MTVTRTHHRPVSRSLALTALFVAPLLSGACAEEKQQSADARRAESYGTGIVSMETVQKAMAMNRRAAEEAARKAQEPPPVEVSAPAPEVPVTPRPRTRVKAQTLAHAPAASAAPAPATTVVPAAAVTEASPVVAAPAPIAAELPPATPTLKAALFADEVSPIYSKDDQDVVPARPVSSQIGGGLDVTIADVNTMELVISKFGRVEQVKLSAPAKRMTDMVLLSSAKTWKFTPATKNGQPVRYRTLYSWETTR
jgi:hypothetical protein